MADAYEAWQETKRRLDAAEHEDEKHWLGMLERNLRMPALEDRLRNFVVDNWSPADEGVLMDPETVQPLLTDLDELRQPQYKPDETREQMRFEVGKVLDTLKGLNWTGDHTYGDALSDAGSVLHSVLSGKGFPKLERFRCPSLYQPKNNPLLPAIRCELQLPHDGKHAVANVGEWTDAQSENPPVPYDAPEPTDAQLDKIADEVFGTGNSDPINRPLVVDPDAEELSGHPVRSDDGACGALNDVHPGSAEHGCVRAKRHDGLHRDGRGMRWEK